ncbi:MAG: NINE protein [Campylobacteraceae bacterium]|nr:NINE protein [Campylobacteraceae bacterium]
MSDFATKAVDEKFCSECGSIIKAKAEICPKCGVRQRPAPSAFSDGQGGRSRIGAALFALFLGGFGAHKFYLGKVEQGVIYLIFFWTLIPYIIAFVEFIIYLTMSDEAFNAKYNNY